MATIDNKDVVYPKVTPQSVSAFSADTSFSVLKGSKVASLVSAINARTQTQLSSVQFKQNIHTRTSDNFQIGTRHNSYSSCEIQPQTLSNRLDHEISDRFCGEFSGDELEVPALSVAMTRSLGRNEFSRLKPDSHRNFRLSGDLISTKSSNTSFHTMGPVSKSLKVIPKGKVESNPFLQLDRQRTKVQSSVCKHQPNFTATPVNRKDHLKDSMSIKMRIKMWSEMEMESKQQQVPIERRKSAHFPISCNEVVPLGSHDGIMVSADQTRLRSTSMLSLHIDTTKRMDELAVANTKAICDVTAESEGQRAPSPLNIEDQLHVYLGSEGVDKDDAVSVEGSSEVTASANQKENSKRNVKDSSSGVSKGLSKLSTKLLSPRFHRKKLELEHQGDNKPVKEIGSRSTKKRKAFKNKVASATRNSNYAPDELVFKPGSDASIQKTGAVDDDDDVFPLEELNRRASSVGENSRKNMIMAKKRAESQPIDPQQLSLTTGMQAEVEPNVLDDSGSGDSSSDSESYTTNIKLGMYMYAHYIFRIMVGCLDVSACFFHNVGPACSSLDTEMVHSTSAQKRRASENVKSSICASPEKSTRIRSISPYQDVSFYTCACITLDKPSMQIMHIICKSKDPTRNGAPETCMFQHISCG